MTWFDDERTLSNENGREYLCDRPRNDAYYRQESVYPLRKEDLYDGCGDEPVNARLDIKEAVVKGEHKSKAADLQWLKWK